MNEKTSKQPNKTKKPKRVYFDSLWKTEPYKERNVIFFYDFEKDEDRKQFIEFEKTCRYLVNVFSNIVLDGLKKEKFSLKDVKQQKFHDYLKNLPDSQELFKKYKLSKARIQRSICGLASRFYKGYSARNKKLPKLAPTLKEKKALFFADGVINNITYTNNDKTEGYLSLSTFGDEGKKTKPLKVLFKVPKSPGMLFKLQYLVKSPGGNIDKKNNRIVFAVKIPFKWKYEPQSAIGFDINKNKDNFIYFSEEIKLFGAKKSSRKFKHGRDSYVLNLENKLKEINKLVKSEEMWSSRRRRLRKSVKKRHRQLNKIYIPICQSIIDYVVKNKKLLCIDNLKCGAKHGSFGQDKIVKLLRTMCEDQKVPHVVVPTPYTSKSCNKCKTKCEDRPKHDKTICPNCGEFNSHDNASLNVRDWGTEIWNEDIFKVSKRIRSKYKGEKSSLD